MDKVLEFVIDISYDEFIHDDKTVFERYSLLKDEVVIRIVSTLVIIYKYIEGLPYKDFLSINKKEAIRKKLSGKSISWNRWIPQIKEEGTE